MTDTTKQVDRSWQPPTPTSTQIAFHSPNLPVDHLVLLPPPLVPTHNSQNRRRSTSDQDQVNRFYPSQLLPPLELPSQPTSISHVQSQMRHQSPPTMSWEAEYTKPPRRSAAIAAARNIPRNPSPLELDSDDGSFSPPPLVVPSSATNSAGAASKRKVSHSLIERRRREKINDCLATLKETVPNLKEEGEKKIAKAKERGRKRGRGDDAGERGGLHKLEILQGTIEYITTLRARIEQLEAATTNEAQSQDLSSPSFDPASSVSSQVSSTSSTTTSTRLDSLANVDSCGSSTTTEDANPSPIMSREEADHAANMLLYFSTSPELRPVVV